MLCRHHLKLDTFLQTAFETCQCFNICRHHLKPANCLHSHGMSRLFEIRAWKFEGMMVVICLSKGRLGGEIPPARPQLAYSAHFFSSAIIVAQIHLSPDSQFHASFCSCSRLKNGLSTESLGWSQDHPLEGPTFDAEHGMHQTISASCPWSAPVEGFLLHTLLFLLQVC